MKKVIHLNHHRKGAVALEFLLNMLIYLPLFFLLFQSLLIPLQQFYLTQAARSCSLVYIQIKHYDSGDETDLKEILNKMLPDIFTNSKEFPSDFKFDANKDKKIIHKKAIEYYIRKQFENSKTLPGKLFDPSKIKVEITDTSCIEESDPFLYAIKSVWKLFAQLFSTEQVTIKLSYPFTLFKVFDLSFGTYQITGEYSVRYNP